MNEQVEPKYNEKKRKCPKNKYPRQSKFSLRQHIGAYARYKLEEVASFAHGVNLSELEEAGISGRELVRYRAELQAAIRAAISEGRPVEVDDSRHVALSYVGAFGFRDDTAVLAGVASNPQEDVQTRGVALEALARLGGETAQACARACLHDPHPVIQEKAIRCLTAVGDPSDCERLRLLAEAKPEAEVVRRAEAAVARLAPQQQLSWPKMPKRSRKKRRLIEETSIVRPIGQANLVGPQTQFSGDEQPSSFGGRDLVGEALANLELELSPVVTSFEAIPGAVAGMVRFRIPGKDLPLDDCCSETVIHRVSPEESIVEVPAKQLRPGRALPFARVDAQRRRFPVWVPGAAASPKVLSVEAVGETIWRSQGFQLKVRFATPAGQRVPFLRLRCLLPCAGWHELLIPIDEGQQEAGEVIVGDYVANTAGPIRVEVTIYASGGGADVARANFLALPTNPIWVSVVPQTRGTNGEGPAHYNSGENRFYCYARCTFTNGYPHSVTVGSNVTCRVTDGGNHLDTFNFSIGTTSVPANSSRVINIYTYFGNGTDTYDVFKDFGDVTMEFTFDTSEEDVSDSNVWAAMAQIKLALNFVGNISAGDRAAIQSITENEASSILEQQSLYISETRRFLLPSSDSDFNRYRDIEMDDNKDSDCTAGSDEADDLRDDWSSPTEWLDVWIVESFSGPACAAGITGFSPVDGPTGKGGSRSGYVLRRNGRDLVSADGRTRMGRTIAHELGHFLGLEHHSDTSNFMYKSNGLTRTDILHGQYLDMADHGFIERFVP